MLDCVREGGEGALVDIRVVPNAKREELRLDGGRLKVKVREQPEKGKANKAVLEMLSAALGDCELVSGQRSREKTVRVRGKSAAEVEKLLLMFK